ncbi:hypothetical protein OS493_006436 [Desmophyllum pertusum]|uniref:Uncharacterized protein n=1 Tax=Desmophyllum pertusum TaxID=174260 RepID=A0A9X0A8D2_9CNID|nr:hypothetical protein OS493_006436 [Desmophyllum pertusum]
MELLVNTLATWRRELYTKVTGKTGTGALAKQKLQDLIGQWQKKAIVSEKVQRLHSKLFKKKQNARFVLDISSTYWVQMTAERARRRNDCTQIKLLPKCICAWKDVALERTRNNAQCRRSGTTLPQTWYLNSFQTWKERFPTKHEKRGSPGRASTKDGATELLKLLSCEWVKFMLRLRRRNPTRKSLYIEWTEKTRQMQRAKELHNQTSFEEEQEEIADQHYQKKKPEAKCVSVPGYMNVKLELRNQTEG